MAEKAKLAQQFNCGIACGSRAAGVEPGDPREHNRQAYEVMAGQWQMILHHSIHRFSNNSMRALLVCLVGARRNLALLAGEDWDVLGHGLT